MDSIRWLVNHGADMSLFNKDGGNCFHIASLKNNTDFMKIVMELGIDVDCPTRSGETALFISILAKNKTVATLLIENGANLRPYVKPSKKKSCSQQPVVSTRRLQIEELMSELGWEDLITLFETRKMHEKRLEEQRIEKEFLEAEERSARAVQELLASLELELDDGEDNGIEVGTKGTSGKNNGDKSKAKKKKKKGKP